MKPLRVLLHHSCLRAKRPTAWLGLTAGLALCITAKAQPELRSAEFFRADSVGLSYRARWATAPAPRRVRAVAVGIGGGAAAVVGGLGAAWYTGEQVPFRWFDDSREWVGLDKAGHVWGAFQQSRAAVDRLRWAGLSRGRALAWGAPVGVVLQGTIEYFDGRSPGYGASAADLAANVAGTALLAGQVALWDKPRVWPKMGVHLTRFARLRPNTLGATVPERLLKDYNGQTHWLAADVGAFLPAANRWPRWLGVAVGYGAEGLVYGEPAQNRAAGFRPVRQFYIGPDMHLLNVRTRSKVLRRLFYVLSIVRLPAPALEVRSTGGVRLHGFYF